MAKFTQLQFLQKASTIHNNYYNYSKAVYVNANIPVTIICPKHGEFEQNPWTHMNGSNCKKCISEKRGENRRIGQEEFIKRANKIHNFKYDYSKMEFSILSDKLIIICPIHSEFIQTGADHIGQKSGCPKCGDKRCADTKRYSFEEFVQEARKIHGDRYFYKSDNFQGVSKEITIICSKHGEFQQIGKSHIKGHGCEKCGKERQSQTVKENNNFLQKAKAIHGELYDYSKVEYNKKLQKVCIICSTHGEFWQSPSNHTHKTRPQGCPKCGDIKTKNYLKENPNGWTLTNWKKSAKKSKNFDSFKVYVVKCWNEEEEFYKIGRTFRKVRERFSSILKTYKIEVIKIFEGTASQIYKMEQKLKKKHKKYKYTPKIDFDGMYECFSNLEL